jgi:ribonucleoside-diphosphate reductase alpha chain
MEYFRKHNPHMVETKPNGDLCLTFPVSTPKGAVCLNNTKAIEFMNCIFRVYDSWILGGHKNQNDELTHNISATVVVGVDEWDEVLQHAWVNRDRIRAMSFFPKFGDKGVPYAPREEVLEEDEGRWHRLISKYKPVDYAAMREDEDETNLSGEAACAGGACELVHTESKPIAKGSIFSTDCIAIQTADNAYLHLVPCTYLGEIQVWESVYRRKV